MVVQQIASKSTQGDQEEHRYHQNLKELCRYIEAVGGQAISQGKEGEELDIPLNQQFEQYPPEAKRPEDAAYLEVEEQMKDSVEKEDNNHDEGHMEGEIVHGTPNE